MANTAFQASSPAGVNLYQVDTVPQFALGTIAKGLDSTLGAGEFVYLKGVTSCVEGSWVTFKPKNYTAVLLAANAIGSVGVAMAAVDAATKYGWFQIYGRACAKFASGFVDDGLVYATSTAGTADDAVVAGDRVKQAYGASALDTPVTGQAYATIHYPWMDDATAA